MLSLFRNSRKMFAMTMQRSFMYRQTTLLRPMVNFQAMGIHQRGYTNYDDHDSFHFHEINFALHAAKNTPNITFLYQKYGDKMTDMQIMYGFNYIATNRLEKTPEFWNVIVPMVKEQMQGLDSQTPGALILGIQAAGEMQLQDNEFWETVD